MDISEILKTAIRGELEGRELYKTMAEKTDDSRAKEIFSKMSDEENSHLEILQQILKHIAKGEDYTIPQIPKKVTFEAGESPIFSKDFKKRIKDKHFEMSALSMALKLEYDSFTFYSQCEKDTDDKALKSFFKYLSAWEKEHYDNINKQMKFLEDDYFVANQFTPF